MTKTKLIGGVVAAAALLAPTFAAAQDPFEPLGIRARAFLIYPSLTASGTYDDNVFATKNDTEDDFIFTLRPEVRAESQWSRHSLAASAFGEFGFYAEEDDSNYEDFGGALDGRLDVTRDSATFGRLSVQRLSEDRESADDTGNADVTQYWDTEARLRHRHSFARLFVQPSVFARRIGFENAGDVSNADRDRNIYGGGFRAGVTVSPAINVFGEVNADVIQYDDAGEINDSNGYDARAGVEVDISRLVIGEASLGYAYRQNDNFENEGGLAGDIGITWNPTQLTSVDFVGRAGFDETTVTFEDDRSSGNLATGIGATVNHELRRNIRLNANAEYQRDDFQGTNRVDDTFRVGAGVSYLLNRNLSVDASYRFDTRSSDAEAEEFDRNIFRIGVTARL
jgi:hypothetical protein